jgi:hypothetical protein
MAITRTFPSSADVSFTAALGPFKLQMMVIQAANTDTVVSTLQNVQAVGIMPSNADLSGDSGNDDVSATFSGKTITIHDPTASRDYILFIIGN